MARSRALHQQHSDLPTLLYLEAQGLEKPMHGIMEHARGWCKSIKKGGVNTKDVSGC
jgi:hypothetical protein